jgi:hypothetical protein
VLLVVNLALLVSTALVGRRPGLWAGSAALAGHTIAVVPSFLRTERESARRAIAATPMFLIMKAALYFGSMLERPSWGRKEH